MPRCAQRCAEPATLSCPCSTHRHCCPEARPALAPWRRHLCAGVTRLQRSVRIDRASIGGHSRHSHSRFACTANRPAEPPCCDTPSTQPRSGPEASGARLPHSRCRERPESASSSSREERARRHRCEHGSPGRCRVTVRLDLLRQIAVTACALLAPSPPPPLLLHSHPTSCASVAFGQSSGVVDRAMLGCSALSAPAARADMRLLML